MFSEFSPLGSVEFCLRLASGSGSRGNTPLHIAAREGSDSVVQRLLEAKAAVDAEDGFRRGLGEGFEGKPLEAWDSVVRGSEGRC